MRQGQDTPKKPPVVGLTGGLGAGKSTVSGYLAKKGAFVIEADRVGHEVISRIPVLADLVAVFGKEIVGEDGQVLRQVLAAKVFRDPQALAQLNAITHPPMARLIQETIANVLSQPLPPPLVVLDAAVLFEAGWDKLCQMVWTVSTPSKIAVDRLIRQNRLTPDQAVARMQFQLSNAERESRAHKVIHNEGSLESLLAQVDRLWQDTLDAQGLAHP